MSQSMIRNALLICGILLLLLVLNCVPPPDSNNNDTSAVIDADGNVYHTKKIGNQIWTVENLKTTKFNDNTPIPRITDDSAWSNCTTPGYCWYKNDSVSYKNTNGALYNWYAVHTGKLAPEGWHVPTDADWDILTAYLGGDSVAGGKLKEAGTAHWNYPNTGATNETGFSALPCGFRSNNGGFSYIGDNGYWWSATKSNPAGAYYRNIFYYYSNIYSNVYEESCGFSVRLVKD
jgi:uncharacterized protein (TIGR02145 family)